MKNLKNISTTPGKPLPLGASLTRTGVNFALFSSSAKNVSLGFFNDENGELHIELPLNPTQNKTGDIWHIHVESLKKRFHYAFRVNQNWVLDPYAKQLNAPFTWGKSKHPLLGVVPAFETPFDWEKDKPLQTPFEKLILYEMHTRGFTQDKSSQVDHPGTFLGLIEKIPYLKELGITAVELLPIFLFDELANTHKNPKTHQKLFNYWGYSTLNFFTPMAPYGTIHDFKTMVKALHRNGIEVLLDVVFNHVGGNAFHQIDKSTYFILDENGHDTNYTGCGNTINCNHPVVIEFILSSLRYWVVEMHVDGFRFDLASIFSRGENGKVLENPPIIKTMNHDPILKKTKFIAEAWDCAGLYQVGSFPGGKRWAEWNGKFRDTARRFLKGTDGQSNAFASILTGSQDLYGHGRAPYHSINFITAHDGFTLHDLVSYDKKHNAENGEKNRDGNDWNESWNCGEEGPTKNPEIEALRQRQIRNFLLALGLSIGTPMLLMGDEYGHTRNGNNNTYCQDNRKNYFLWDALKNNTALYQFAKKIFSIRKSSPFFQRKTFLTDKDITWHGHLPAKPNWNHENRFVACSFKDEHHSFYLAFNAHFDPAHLTLPRLPKGKKWKRIIDTSLVEAPEEIVHDHYYLSSHSALLLLA